MAWCMNIAICMVFGNVNFKETLIQSLSDLALVFSCKARNKPPRIASYVRRVMTKHGMKIHAKSDSAIASAFPSDS